MAAEEAVVLPLPELPSSQTGTSVAANKNYKASVSNASGYLCHISLECSLDVPPQVLFDIFCHPDNAAAFRDIKKVGYRKVKSESPGLKLVEVEQCGELRVMWISRTFRTYLDVTEDARDPDCLKTDFSLLRSDILSRFHGSWELRPRRNAAGTVVGCHAVLEQDVLPKGVPSFFAHLPVLGGLLRRVSLNAIQRLMEDILNIVNKYTAAGGKKSLDAIMEQIAAERGHKTRKEENRGKLAASSNSNVASFAIDSFSESEEEEQGGGSSSEGSLAASASDQEASAGRAVKEGALQAAGAGSTGSRGASEGGASSSSSIGGYYRPSADGVVTAVLVAPAAAGACAAGDKTAAAGDEAATAAAAAAAGDKEQAQHHQAKHHHRRHHEHKQRQPEPAPLVGLLLDVSQHGHVHVALLPNPDAVTPPPER